MKTINAQDAETIALQALAHVIADEDLLPRFFALSGADEDDMRNRATSPEFLGSVMDFILGDEQTAREFALAHHHSPETLQMTRALLPGGDLPHWT